VAKCILISILSAWRWHGGNKRLSAINSAIGSLQCGGDGVSVAAEAACGVSLIQWRNQRGCGVTPISIHQRNVGSAAVRAISSYSTPARGGGGVFGGGSSLAASGGVCGVTASGALQA